MAGVDESAHLVLYYTILLRLHECMRANFYLGQSRPMFYQRVLKIIVDSPDRFGVWSAPVENEPADVRRVVTRKGGSLVPAVM